MSSLEAIQIDGGEKFQKLKMLLGEGDTLKGVELIPQNNKQKSDLTSLMKKYIDALCKNIKTRMSSGSELLLKFGEVFEPKTYNASDPSVADRAIRDLGDMYGTERDVAVQVIEGGQIEKSTVPALINKDKLISVEWPVLKGMLKGTYRSFAVKNLCQRLIMVHHMLLPNISKLCEVALCICVTSVICERSFSYQNRIKSKFRASMKATTLDGLMKIKMIGPDIEDCDFTAAIKRWHLKKRRLGRLVQPYRMRPKKQKTD